MDQKLAPTDPQPNPNQTQAALHEALRLNPPGWMTSRECVADTDVGGWAIPAGSVIYIDIHGIQRSPGEPWLPGLFLCLGERAGGLEARLANTLDLGHHQLTHPLTDRPSIHASSHTPEHWGPDPLTYRPERFFDKGSAEFKARHPLAHMVRFSWQ
jgi:cytochrome P450